MPDPDSARYLSRGYQGVVYVQGEGADRRVIKRATGGWLVRRLRAAMLRREYRAYERLGGIAGIPRCHGLDGDGSLVLQFLEGESYRETVPALREHRDRFFAQLKRQLLAIHAAGVAHADLKRRGNILVGADGEPILLDFGSSILRRPRGGWLNRLVFRQACRMDLNAWIKLKYQRRYDALSPEDQPFYRPTLLEGIARALRRTWRKLSGRSARKAWREKRRDRRRAGREPGR